MIRLAVSLLLCIVTGCTYHDGTYKYRVSGRIVDCQGNPIPGMDLTVARKFDEAHNVLKKGGEIVVTQIDGQFSTTIMTGLAWGYQEIMGIPLENPREKYPPDLTNVYVYVKINEKWICYKTKIKDNVIDTNMQYEKQIVLETIIISKRGRSDAIPHP